MKEYKSLEGVKRICGDYAAWHEVGTYCEYIYGRPETLGDIGEQVCELLDCDWDELREQTTENIDRAVHRIVDESENEYCDIENDNILCLIQEGKVIKTYLEI